MQPRARPTTLAFLIVLLLGACNEAPPGLLAFGSPYNYTPVYVPGERVLLMLTYFRRRGAGFGRVMTLNGLAWNVTSTYYIVGDRVNSTNSSERSELLTEFVQRIEAVQPGTP
jgi:hypothetical protein